MGSLKIPRVFFSVRKETEKTILPAILAVILLTNIFLPVKVSHAALPAPTIDTLSFNYAVNALSGNGTCTSGAILYVNIYDSSGNVYYSGGPNNGVNTFCTNGQYSFTVEFNRNTLLPPTFDLNNPNRVEMFNLIFPSDIGNSPQPDDIPAVAFFTRTLPNTLTGNNVSVSLLNNNASLTFENVAVPGDTTITSTTGGTPPPTGFKLDLLSTYYEIATRAEFNGSVLVCFKYDPTNIVGNEADLSLLHHDSALGSWVDITFSHDLTNHIICGATDSFSPFVVATKPSSAGLISIIRQMNLNPEFSDNLIDKLQDAQSELDHNDSDRTEKAIQRLKDFVKKVEDQRNKKLSNNQATLLHNYGANLILILMGNTVINN